MRFIKLNQLGGLKGEYTVNPLQIEEMSSIKGGSMIVFSWTNNVDDGHYIHVTQSVKEIEKLCGALNKHDRVTVVNEFDEDRYENFVNGYINDGYKLHSSSCQPNSEGDMVWGAVLLLEAKS